MPLNLALIWIDLMNLVNNSSDDGLFGPQKHRLINFFVVKLLSIPIMQAF